VEYNPIIAKACPYPYYWLAEFRNGEKVAQYSDIGEEVLYREVLDGLEAGRELLYVAWIPVETDKPSYTLYLQSWQRPIVLRRHSDTVHTGTGIVDRKVLFLLGWQATIAQRNYKSIMFIDPETGSIEVKEEL